MSDYRIRIGRNGTQVHRGNSEGVVHCGAQRRAIAYRGVSFLPADTPVTCRRCGADPAPATPAPVVPARPLCPNHSFPLRLNSDGTCGLCDY